MNPQHSDARPRVPELSGSRRGGMAAAAWSCSVIAEPLAAAGGSVGPAAEAASGRSLVEQVQPAGLLLDLPLPLPLRSGLEVRQRLTERQPTGEIPISVISGYAGWLMRDAAARADRLVQTSCDPNERLDQVRNVKR